MKYSKKHVKNSKFSKKREEERVPKDQNFWFLEFLKISKNIFVLQNFWLCHSKKGSLRVPTNQNCDSVQWLD